MNNKTDVSELAEKILKHKRLYYQGKPELSDREYDSLEDQLKQVEPNHPVLQIVGSDQLSSNKVVHATPMLSLKKTYEIKSLVRWFGDHDVVATIKIDGNSLSLVYEKGQLIQAKTRGDGQSGENVLQKILWAPEVPKKLPENFDLEVRGELVCTQKNFKKLKIEMIEQGLEEPSNERNIVAGVLGRKKFFELARYFDFLAFDLISQDTSLDQKIVTEQQKLDYLQSLGFTTPPTTYMKSHSEDVSEGLNHYIHHAFQDISKLDYAADGLVFTYNDLKLHQSLGATSHHPRYKMVFKRQGETARSRVVDIIWNTSRLGILTPVAIIEGVDLSGAKITNITLHNASNVAENNIKVGDEIEIVRSGDVIPKYLQTTDSANGNYEWPNKCKSCGSEVIFDEVRLVCPAEDSCPAQQSGRILNWIKVVGIDDLSEKRLQQLIDARMVLSIPDLYSLGAEDFLKLEKTKSKLAEKLSTNIERSKNIPADAFFAGLGIASAGRSSWQKILAQLTSLDRVFAASAEEIALIDGFAEKTSVAIVEGVVKNKTTINKLLKAGVDPQFDALSVANEELPLSGKSFVITGTLSKPRKEIETWIKDRGGKTSSAVSAKTFALVCNQFDSTSSKMTKAKSFNIKILSEDQLEGILDD